MNLEYKHPSNQLFPFGLLGTKTQNHLTHKNEGNAFGEVFGRVAKGCFSMNPHRSDYSLPRRRPPSPLPPQPRRQVKEDFPCQGLSHTPYAEGRYLELRARCKRKKATFYLQTRRGEWCAHIRTAICGGFVLLLLPGGLPGRGGGELKKILPGPCFLGEESYGWIADRLDFALLIDLQEREESFQGLEFEEDV